VQLAVGFLHPKFAKSGRQRDKAIFLKKIFETHFGLPWPTFKNPVIVVAFSVPHSLSFVYVVLIGWLLPCRSSIVLSFCCVDRLAIA